MNNSVFVNKRVVWTTYNTEKCKKYEIRFKGKTTRFQWNFIDLDARLARFDINSKVHQFCKSESSYFMRETDLILDFDEIQ